MKTSHNKHCTEILLPLLLQQRRQVLPSRLPLQKKQLPQSHLPLPSSSRTTAAPLEQPILLQLTVDPPQRPRAPAQSYLLLPRPIIQGVCLVTNIPHRSRRQSARRQSARVPTRPLSSVKGLQPIPPHPIPCQQKEKPVFCLLYVQRQLGSSHHYLQARDPAKRSRGH